VYGLEIWIDPISEEEVGIGNGLIASTAPVLDPTDEGELEIGP